MEGITLFRLLFGILFIEGVICILMAAPFFYAVGFLIGIFADKARAKREFEKRVRFAPLPAHALGRRIWVAVAMMILLEVIFSMESMARDHRADGDGLFGRPRAMV